MAKAARASKSKPKPETHATASVLPGTDLKIDPRIVPLLEPIGAVGPDPANPRKIRSRDPLRASVLEFGVRRLVVANRTTGLIEAGHQLHAVLREAGATHVPVLWVEDDPRAAKRFMVADNRASDLVAEWDDDLVSKLLGDVDLGLEDFDLTEIVEGKKRRGRGDKNERNLDVPLRWAVIVDVAGEKEQAALIEELEKRGMPCRPMMA